MTTTAEQAASPRYASPVDFGAYGQYGAGRGFDLGGERRQFGISARQGHFAAAQPALLGGWLELPA